MCLVYTESLESTKCYVIIPIISHTNKSKDPWLVLSKMVIVTRFSNPELITNYFNNQWLKACDDFRMDPINSYFSIKYRSVIFAEK